MKDIKIFKIIFIGILTLILFNLSVTALPLDKDVNLEFQYPTNYSTVNVNSSDYWDGLDTPSDILFSDLSPSDIDISGYSFIGSFLQGVVGAIDMRGDPWYLSGTDLEIDQDLDINSNLNVGGDTTLNNLNGSGTLNLTGNEYHYGNIFLEDIYDETHHLNYDLENLDQIHSNVFLTPLDQYTFSNATGDYIYLNTTTGGNIVVNIGTTTSASNYRLDYNNITLELSSGTDASPVLNRVYVYLNAGVPTWEVSLTEPTVRHAMASRILVGSSGTVYSSSLQEDNDNGFMKRVQRRFRKEGILYESGLDFTATSTDLEIGTGNYINGIYDKAVSDSITLTDGFYVVRSDGTYVWHNSFDDITQYSDGNTIGNNKYFNVVFGVTPFDGYGNILAVVQEEPSTEYTSMTSAYADSDNTLKVYPSEDFLKVMFLPVARMILNEGDGAVALPSGNYAVDYRGGVAGGVSSGGGLSEVDPVWTADKPNYVPYQGATDNLNLSSYNMTANYYFGDGSQLTGISAGFNTDQNDELNTTGSPSFQNQTINEYLILNSTPTPRTYDYITRSSNVITGKYWQSSHDIGTITPSNCEGNSFGTTEFDEIGVDDGTYINEPYGLLIEDGQSSLVLINISLPDIPQENYYSINATLNGYYDGTNEDLGFYVWNDGTSSWTLLDTGTSTGSDETLTGGVITDVEDYVNSNNLIYFLAITTGDRTDGFLDGHLYIDYFTSDIAYKTFLDSDGAKGNWVVEGDLIPNGNFIAGDIGVETNNLYSWGTNSLRPQSIASNILNGNILDIGSSTYDEITNEIRFYFTSNKSTPYFTSINSNRNSNSINYAEQKNYLFSGEGSNDGEVDYKSENVIYRYNGNPNASDITFWGKVHSAYIASSSPLEWANSRDHLVVGETIYSYVNVEDFENPMYQSTDNFNSIQLLVPNIYNEYQGSGTNTHLGALFQEDVAIETGNSLYFDGSLSAETIRKNNTRITYDSGNDALDFYVGGTKQVSIQNDDNVTLWVNNNVSATGYITRTSVYDKSDGNALDFIKDADEYIDEKGEIKHSEFNGYTTYYVTDYSRPEIRVVEVEVMKWNETSESEYLEVKEIEEVYYPHKKIEEGVNLEAEINVLRQGISEYKEAGKPMESENKTIFNAKTILAESYLTNTTKDPETLTKVESFYNNLNTKSYEEIKNLILTPEGKLSDEVLFDYENSNIGSYDISAIAHTSRAIEVLSLWRIAKIEDKQNQQLDCWDLTTQQEIVQCMRNI